MASNFTHCLTINNIQVADPVQYTPKLAAIDAASSGRNDNGVMTREVVRRNVASIQVGWEMLTNEELETILSALDNDEFTVSFYYGTYHTAQMYHGDLNLEMRCAPSASDVRWNLNTSLIEY